MNYSPVDSVREGRDETSTDGESESRPGWVTVIVVVATLAFIALPRAIVPTGLSPVLFVVSAIVLVFWLFGKD